MSAYGEFAPCKGIRPRLQQRRCPVARIRVTGHDPGKFIVLRFQAEDVLSVI
jgi:hypothetical protein